MQFVYTSILALATVAFASPTAVRVERSPVTARQIVPTYDPNLPIILFTNLTCALSAALTPGQPLMVAFPTAEEIGTIVGPTLVNAIGSQTVSDIDVVAENLCVSANQNPLDGNGLCNDIFQAVNDLVQHDAPASADKYRCLLNMICIANPTPDNVGTCQFLLAGVDCVANRIIQDDPPECGTS